MRKARAFTLAATVLSALCGASFAQSPSDLITQGNAQFTAKNYDKAAELYKQAQAAKHAPAAALYNEGCVLLEQGKPAEAAERFRAADAAASGDAEVAARARFNLGQALYRQADATKEKQAEQALDLLRQSAAAFRSVLEANPGDAEAARNVEIARRLMKQIDDQRREEQQKQQQQKGGQQNKDQQQGQDQQNDQEAKEAQQQADQLKDLAQRQRQAAEDSQRAEQSGADQQKLDQLGKQQQSIKGDTAKAQEQQDKQQQSGGSTSDQLKKAQSEQQRAMDELQKQNPSGARGHQEQAAKLLDEAAKRARQKADEAKQKGKDGKGQQQDKGDPQKGDKGESAKAGKAEPTKEQNYDTMAAALLDRERKLHQQRQPAIRAQRGTGAPVEKDW